MSKPSVKEIAESLGISTNQVSQLRSRGMPVSKIKLARVWFDENGFSKVNHSKVGAAVAQPKTVT